MNEDRVDRIVFDDAESDAVVLLARELGGQWWAQCPVCRYSFFRLASGKLIGHGFAAEPLGRKELPPGMPVTMCPGNGARPVPGTATFYPDAA